MTARSAWQSRRGGSLSAMTTMMVHADCHLPREPDGSVLCYWNGHGSSATTRLKDSPSCISCCYVDGRLDKAIWPRVWKLVEHGVSLATLPGIHTVVNNEPFHDEILQSERREAASDDYLRVPPNSCRPPSVDGMDPEWCPTDTVVSACWS